jgi:hypothetical protein
LPTGSFSLFSILYFLPIFLLSSIPCRVDNTPAGISFSSPSLSSSYLSLDNGRINGASDDVSNGLVAGLLTLLTSNSMGRSACAFYNNDDDDKPTHPYSIHPGLRNPSHSFLIDQTMMKRRIRRKEKLRLEKKSFLVDSLEAFENCPS